ncbi:two-component regulator propeller domain-containing protein [Spiroplasma sp. SV19]|uniref:two-component regulator propeller domain-containing protein n=1 Tax=Spiroplasma sp. SV19 TaxID=2570468 RepID=UPI0024B6ED20|nr:two-component regulator propeller domain-containing protein [Spiroplasma sp. SV19]WHQ36396.1 hypothetical protein E7Y35_00340 [Spiroplasma sp. SV19]
MNDKVILNYNKLCEKCKNIFQKIMLTIKRRNPEMLKTVEFYQIIIDEKITVAPDVLPFSLIKHDNELYGFFLHRDLNYLNYDAKQLLQAGIIKLPSSVLTAVQKQTINFEQQLTPVALQQNNEMMINDDSHDVTQAIAQLNANQKQIIQGLTTTSVRLKQRHQKITRILVLLGVVLMLLFIVVGVGGWQLYVYSHRVTYPVLEERKVSIANIKTLDGPELLVVPTPAKVTESDIRRVYDVVVQTVVKEINDKAKLNDDYSYDLYADENEGRYQPVNLVSGNVAEVWIVITAKFASKLITGYTVPIKVTLRTHKKIVSLSDGSIRSMVRSSDGSLYVGTDNSNVWRIAADRVVTKFVSLKDDEISSMVLSSDGLLYVGTYNSNVWRVAVDEKTLMKFVSLDDSFIHSIVLLSNGMLYVGTANSNVWRVAVDRVMTKFVRLSDGGIHSMVLSSDNSLYMGTGNLNVWWLASDGKKLMKVAYLDESLISSMVLSSDGLLYVGTENSRVWRIAVIN